MDNLEHIADDFRPVIRRPFVMVAVVSAAVLIPVRLAISHDRSDVMGGKPHTTSTPTIRRIICVQVGRVDPGYCLHRASDAANRTELTEAQRSRGQVLARPIIAAIAERHLAERCVAVESPLPAGDPPPCDMQRIPLSVEDVRAVLGLTGRDTAVVRIARDNDPAPANSVVYAVPLADACLLGFIDTETRQWDIVGQLPGSTCLTP